MFLIALNIFPNNTFFKKQHAICIHDEQARKSKYCIKMLLVNYNGMRMLSKLKRLYYTLCTEGGGREQHEVYTELNVQTYYKKYNLIFTKIKNLPMMMAREKIVLKRRYFSPLKTVHHY